MERKNIIILFLCILTFCQILSAQPEIYLPFSSFEIDQVFVDLPEISIYFWCTDYAGGMIRNPDASKFKVTLNGKSILKKDNYELEQFRIVDEGVAYTILIDVSKSVAGKDIENAKIAALGLVENMREKDKAMIILFGDWIEVLVPFSNNKHFLKNKINSIQAKANNTKLFKGIETAFKQNNTLDKKIPKRKAIIVISDGKDEGSGITLDDLKEQITFPVYSIGFREGKKEFIESLKRISEISGGQYIHLTNIEDAKWAYEKIANFIENQWLLRVETKLFNPDRSIGEIELIYEDQVILSSKKNVRLVSSALPVPFFKKAIRYITEHPIIIVFIFVLLIAISVILPLYLRKKKKLKKTVEEGEKREDVREKEKEPTKISKPKTTGILNFIILEGKEKGLRKSIPVKDKTLKIGADKLSDLLLDDPGVSSEHALIHQEKDYFYIQDNNSKNGTYVNGIKVKKIKRIEEGDVIIVGGTKIRFSGESNKHE